MVIELNSSTDSSPSEDFQQQLQHEVQSYTKYNSTMFAGEHELHATSKDEVLSQSDDSDSDGEELPADVDLHVTAIATGLKDTAIKSVINIQNSLA